MKIGMLVARMDIVGGLETVVLRTARYLLTQGHELRVVTTAVHPQLAEAFRAIDVSVHLIGKVGDVGRIAAIDALAAAAAEALAGCEVVQVHNYPAHIWLHRARPRLGDAVVIYTCQEPPRHLYEEEMDATFLASRFNQRRWYTRLWDRMMGWRWRRLDQAAVPGMQYVLTNTHYTAGKIKQIYGYSAIPCYFSPTLEAQPAPRGPQSGPLRLLFAGRLTPFKNLQTCIEAVALLPASADVLFTIVGEGDQRPHLEALAARLGCAHRVAFRGLVEEAELEAEYARTDLVLYISFDEPMGLVPMEAALREIPSIVSNHAGPAEVVVDGETGLHVDVTQPQQVAAAIMRLHDDPELRQRMGKAAAHRMRTALSFDLYTHTLTTMLGSTRWQVPVPAPLLSAANPLRPERGSAEALRAEEAAAGAPPPAPEAEGGAEP